MKASDLSVNIDSPLLITNLRIPQIHGELIPRDNLTNRLDQASSFPLTFITAPAGFGKTTLLSQWASVSKSRNPRARVAWVSLEKECDLRRFWSYIITALGGITSGIGRSALTLLDVPEPHIRAVLRILINEISEDARDLVLIVDDYHHIDDAAIHETLTFLIDHLPPNLHLMISTRSQPPLALARWRARGWLNELREEDLRFTPKEVAVFLGETKKLDLSPPEMNALGARTEGWVAGLQLIALSIQGFDRESKHHFVSAFTGSQRYILDYLVEEVLQRQPDSIKRFLLETSILDHMNASLCNAVTGQEDGQATLEYLKQARIFTIPLDEEQQWYRYHHLFKDVLYHQLLQSRPDAVRELHYRASKWFIRAGRTEEAIRYACAAQEWDQAIQLIKPVIGIVWNRAEMHKVIEWLEKLPSEKLNAHPDLSLYYARALLHGGQLASADRRLRELEEVLRARLARSTSAENRLLLGTTCAFRTMVASARNELSDALSLGREALSLLPPQSMDMRAYVLNSLGIIHYQSGNLAEAVQFLTQGGALARKAGVLYPMMAAAAFLADTLMAQGQLRQAEQILRQALEEGGVPNEPAQVWSPAVSLVCISYGRLLYERNQLKECEYYVNEAIELGGQHDFGRPVWLAYHMLVRLRLAYGDREGALEMLNLAHHYQRLYSLLIPERLIEAMQADSWIALGQLENAGHWVRSYRPDETLFMGLTEGVENVTLARFYLSQGQPETALGFLDRLRSSAHLSDHQGDLIEVLGLAALAQHAVGEAQQAIETLQTALQLAEPEGYVRTFVDMGQPMAALLYQALAAGVFPEYVARLLALFPVEEVTPLISSSIQNVTSTNVALIEPLSQREIEVLQLMASGASNEEIAGKLVIALTTAKKHVSNILRKLGAENRTQAVARGRSLGLCK